MVVVLWLAFVFVVYTYAGYLLLVWLLSRLRVESSPQPMSTWPGVSVIAPFCKERGRVVAKLATLHAQDYGDEMHIIFVSDGEEGDTTNWVRDLASEGTTTVVLAQRSGKPSALNAAHGTC